LRHIVLDGLHVFCVFSHNFPLILLEILFVLLLALLDGFFLFLLQFLLGFRLILKQKANFDSRSRTINNLPDTRDEGCGIQGLHR